MSFKNKRMKNKQKKGFFCPESNMEVNLLLLTWQENMTTTRTKTPMQIFD